MFKCCFLEAKLVKPAAVNGLLVGADSQHYIQAVHRGRAIIPMGVHQALLGQPGQAAEVLITQHFFAEEQMWRFCNSHQKALKQL